MYSGYPTTSGLFWWKHFNAPLNNTIHAPICFASRIALCCLTISVKALYVDCAQVKSCQIIAYRMAGITGWELISATWGSSTQSVYFQIYCLSSSVHCYTTVATSCTCQSVHVGPECSGSISLVGDGVPLLLVRISHAMFYSFIRYLLGRSYPIEM